MKGKKIYMVGIGGIGMSALAQLYQHEGASVLGSDREESPTTALLESKHIKVFVGHKAEHVPADIDLLVYSDAVPADNPERARAMELKIAQKNYFEALGDVAKDKRVVAIAGTHGKTTTTGMIGKILVDAGEDPTVVIGSISIDFGSNFRAGKSDVFVVEACEYRKHFLTFNPEVLVITNIEFDHTDYFRSLDEVERAFEEAKQQAKIVVETAQYKGESVPELLLPGEFNKDNARAAKAAVKAIAPHISEAQIDASLASCKGTWRRFEYKGMLPGGATLYDDYAHHPTAIEKTIEAAREKFPGQRIVIFFHPHLYSRTRDLFDGFVSALTMADEVYILPVYAAREPLDVSATHEALAEAVNKAGGMAKGISGMEEATEKLKTLGPGIAFTMGAGDVYKAGEAALK